MNAATPVALVLGAASDIGMALAREYARAGYAIILAARDVLRLQPDATDLQQRSGASVRLAEFDVLDWAGHAKFLDGLGALPEVVICVVGLLGNQQATQADPAAADLVMRTNYLGPAIMLDILAARMEARGSGQIIGFSSVAGDRGRASNYAYGSAKAGLTAFISGLRNRLAKTGVRVLTVKPGFVNTRMTAGMALPKLLTAEPDEVARAVFKAAKKGSDVVYVYGVWTLIMMIIRLIPEGIFKRLKL